jgi:hypothetical protein
VTLRLGRALALSIAVAACGGDGSVEPSGPEAGILNVSVESSLTDTGAMLFRINGAFQSVAAANGYQLLSYAPTAVESRVMVVGSIRSGTVLQLTVADKSKPVSVALQQVVGRGYERRPPASYQVTVVR